MTNNDALLKFALDRICVLESLVSELVTRGGAPEQLVQKWREHVANWPDVQHSLTEDTIRLVEEVRCLPKHTYAPREGRSPSDGQ